MNTNQAQAGTEPIELDSKNVSRAGWLRWVFRLLVGVALVTFLASRQDNTALLRAFRLTSWPFLVGAVTFYWAGQLLSAWKWRLLLRAQNAEVSYADCCRLYAVGMFWNLWMPTNIGGDAVRTVRCGALCGSRAVAFSSILAERLTGFLALAFLGGVGFALQMLLAPLQIPSISYRAALLFVAVTASLVGFVLFLQSVRRVHPSPSKWQRKLSSVRQSFAFYLRPSQRSVLWSALSISLIFQASQIALNVWIGQQLGLNVPILVYCWLVPALAFASLVPFGIGGLGVREAAAVQFLSAFGASVPTILAWSLLWQATVWLASLPGVIWAASSPQKHTPSTRYIADKQ